jgi:hypothetical protein
MTVILAVLVSCNPTYVTQTPPGEEDIMADATDIAATVESAIAGTMIAEGVKMTMTAAASTEVPVVETTTPNEFYISDWRTYVSEEDEILYPTEPFEATVILFNGGISEWGKDFKLVWVGGDYMGVEEVQILQKVQPGQFAQFEIALQAPGSAGEYISWWYLETEKGFEFGSGYGGTKVVSISIVVK